MRPMSRLALSALLLALAACGARPSNDRAADAPRVSITSANFTDARPVDWSGIAPLDHPVHGVDLSVWNGGVDWAEAQANGVNFAFLKATEGGDRVDGAFDTNRRAAAAAGVPVGAYHFFYHCRAASEQAAWFIRHVPRSAITLPPVLDMEWNFQSPTCPGKRPRAEVQADARTFVSDLTRHYGKRPILYTTVDFYEENQLWQISGVEFWLRSVKEHPSDRYPGQHWTFWQYSGTGLVPGINGRVDLNTFAGSRAQWQDWLARATG